MQLKEKELLILQDTDFLLTKATVLGKITELLGQTREECKSSKEFRHEYVKNNKEI